VCLETNNTTCSENLNRKIALHAKKSEKLKTNGIQQT
jgi:hypothetical protein